MADLRSHAALLSAELATTFARFLDSHETLRRNEAVQRPLAQGTASTAVLSRRKSIAETDTLGKRLFLRRDFLGRNGSRPKVTHYFINRTAQGLTMPIFQLRLVALALGLSGSNRGEVTMMRSMSFSVA